MELLRIFVLACDFCLDMKRTRFFKHSNGAEQACAPSPGQWNEIGKSPPKVVPDEAGEEAGVCGEGRPTYPSCPHALSRLLPSKRFRAFLKYFLGSYRMFSAHFPNA